MAIRLIDNYPSNGTLKDERDEYLRLFELGGTRTTTGDVSFTSTTSLKSYNTLGTSYAGQGQNGMMNLLFYGDATTPDNPKLVDYAVTSEDVAKIKAASDVIVATGTGTQILLTLTSVDSYEANSKYTFIAGGSNSGAATTININGLGAKNLYKPNTTTAPNIISGKAYTIWYDGTSFFLQASAEGTAVAGDVLAGTTFSNDSDTGIAGTLTLTGTAAVGNVLTGSTFYSTDAKTKLTGTMPNRGTVNITPSTTNQAITSGYHSGSGVVYGDADLVAGNIKRGVNIFGVTGTADTFIHSTSTTSNILTYYLNGGIKTHFSSNYVKQHQFTVNRTGNVRVYFRLTSTDSTVSGYLYVNDVQDAATYSETTGSGSYFTYTLTVSQGDTVSLWTRRHNVGTSVNSYLLSLTYFMTENTNSNLFTVTMA